jgi:hypothetical protein
MIIAIAVVAVGGLLAIAGIIMALLARRKDERHVATEALGGSGGATTAAKLQATAEPSIKIEKVNEIG